MKTAAAIVLAALAFSVSGTELGKARVVGKGVDIGAFECQELQPALRITVR